MLEKVRRDPDKTFAGDEYFGLLSGEEVSIKKINKEEITQPKKMLLDNKRP